MADEVTKNISSEFQSDDEFSEDLLDFEDDFSSDELTVSCANAEEESRRSPEARRWYNSNTFFFERNNWEAIYQNIRKLGPIEHSVIWDDKRSLSMAQFAVSALANKLTSIRKWNAQQKAQSAEYRSCFLKLSDRLITMDPGNDSYRSSKAYFHYNHYISQHHEENDYQEACDLLRDLAQTPAVRFKDAQRYVKLRQKKWENFNHRDDSKLEEISIEYDALIEVFETLNQREQSRCHKNFVSCEYNYAKINIERLWDETLTQYFRSLSFSRNEEYAKKKLEDWKNQDSEGSMQRKAIIQKCRKYLNDVIERIPKADTIDSVQNKNKVRFIEIDYRKAQLLDIQGMLCFIAGVRVEKITYFSEASDLLSNSFGKVDNLMQQKARFNYPWYSKCPYALAEFAVGHFDQASKLLLSVPKDVRPYGFYISARNLLKRMLPFFSLEALFQGHPESLHGIIKYPLSHEMKQKLQLIGFDPNQMKDYKARNIYESQEPIGPSEFLYLLSYIYDQFVRKQAYSDKQESIKKLRFVVSMYTHYTPQYDSELNSPIERINAMYYIYVKKAMTPAKKRTNKEQDKMNRACSDIFEKEMIAALGE